VGRHNATGWWLDEAGGVEARPRLSETLDADVLVIGGGYAGMWTAWHVLEAEPGAKVALLEGDLCGHGPSGRNGGFCESLWFSAATVRDRFGDEPARRLLDAASSTVSDIGAWCEANEVDAWFDQSGYLCVSTGEAFDGVGLAAVEAAAALGSPEAVQDLSAQQVAERCLSPVFGRGVFVPDFATVQPARLALGLRRRLIERGVQVFEHSRVKALRNEPAAGGSNGSARPHAVLAETDAGSVRAAAAVLTVGAAARSVAALSSRLSVTSSHIVMTEPVPDLLEEIGWTGGECITDGRTLLHYFRTTRDGRIVFGWGGGRLACGARLNGRVEVDGEVAAETIGGLERIFPGVRGRRITHAWGGPIDVSPSHLPQVGTLPGAPVHFAFGFTGNGVGPTFLAARALSALALDRRDEYSRLPIVESGAGAWVPPEPLAFVGGSVVRSALLRVEKAAEKGERPDAVSRAVCAAPRLVGMHLGR
jgi:glycine/D-amino acid oxidase-like deaminating enzyme